MAKTNKLSVKKSCPLDSGAVRYIVPAIIMVLGILFIVIGVKDGEINAVLSKATALCRECVGIG